MENSFKTREEKIELVKKVQEIIKGGAETTENACKKLGVSKQKYYTWKSTYLIKPEKEAAGIAPRPRAKYSRAPKPKEEPTLISVPITSTAEDDCQFIFMRGSSKQVEQFLKLISR